jgi:hypothetical protein
VSSVLLFFLTHFLITDKEAPKVIECQKNFTFMTKKAISRIYFPGVKFTDNVGVTKVDFGNGTKVAWGSHHVTVRAYDKAGNTVACEINVLVFCKYIIPCRVYCIGTTM